MHSTISLENKRANDPFFYASIGPIFLMLALSVLLGRVTGDFFPLIALASVGLMCTWAGGNRGFFVSCLTLLALTFWKRAFVLEHLWCAVFLGSVLCSWIIVLVGKKQIRAQKTEDENAQLAMEQERSVHAALQEKYDALYAYAHGNENPHAQALSQTQSTLKQALDELGQVQEYAQGLKQETQLWIARCESLTDEISQLEAREKHSSPPVSASVASTQRIISQHSFEEEGELVPKELVHLQMTYRQLQEQFQEKSDVLTQSRKELFNKEGELLLLQKEQQEQVASLLQSDVQFQRYLDLLEQERCQFEQHIEHLEQIVSSLSVPKKTARPRAAKTLKKTIKRAQDSQQISLLTELG